LHAHRAAHKFSSMITRITLALRGFVTCNYSPRREQGTWVRPCWLPEACRSRKLGPEATRRLERRICTVAHKHTLLARTVTISRSSSCEDSRWASQRWASRPVVVKRVGCRGVPCRQSFTYWIALLGSHWY